MPYSITGHAIFARKALDRAHNQLAVLERVDIEGGNLSHCTALRLGVGMAMLHLETARCHLAEVRQGLEGPRRAKITRIIRSLRLDQVSATTEQLAARQRFRALACMNPHRGPGDLPHQVVHIPNAPVEDLVLEDREGGLVEF